MDKWSHHQHLKQSNSFQDLYNVPSTKSKEDRLRRHFLREHDNKDLGADSLDVVELVMALEEKFEVEIPDSDAEKLITINDVVSYIEKLNK